MRIKIILMLIASLVPIFFVSAYGSNTGGVFGPGVKEGHQSIQYRSAYDPDNHNFAQRLHYQQSTSENLMFRGIIQSRKVYQPDSDIEFDFFQAELFWQLEDVSTNWQQGLRFDARVRSDNRPHQIGLNWMHDFSLSPRVLARFLLLSSTEIGSNARSGINLQSRSSLNYRMNDSWTLSLEMFNNLGTTGNFNGLSNQNHQIGPALTGNLGDGWQIFAGVLAGVTDTTPDQSYRFWLTKSF